MADKIREKAIKLTRALLAVGAVYFHGTVTKLGAREGANGVAQGEKMQGMVKVCLVKSLREKKRRAGSSS